MRRAAIVLAGVLFASVLACAQEQESSGTQKEHYPPNNVLELKEMFDPKLEPLGLRLTRGALIERSATTYSPSSEGSHLALYVEPIGAYTDAQYLDGVVEVTRLFAPEIFDRWPGLESFDVCQEPPAEVDASDEPPAMTVVDLTEEQARAIDWDDVDLAQLLAASMRKPPEMTLRVDPKLEQSPVYKRALNEARVLTAVDD